MVLGVGPRMAGERLDDSAVRDSAATTSADHALEFGLKRLQPRDTALDLPKLTLGDTVCCLARSFRVICQAQEFADGFQGEPQLAAVADERQSVKMRRSETRWWPSVRSASGNRPICS
jgi:hypothetical protein